MPQGEYLPLAPNQDKVNSRRVKIAQDAIRANDELLHLVYRNRLLVQFKAALGHPDRARAIVETICEQKNRALKNVRQT